MRSPTNYGIEETEGNMTTKGVFIVRAEVPEADRRAFENWYENEHLEEATDLFKATGAWRGWSRVDRSIHTAFYEFENINAAVAIQDSDALKFLVSKFDEAWGERVARTRDVIEIAN